MLERKTSKVGGRGINPEDWTKQTGVDNHPDEEFRCQDGKKIVGGAAVATCKKTRVQIRKTGPQGKA